MSNKGLMIVLALAIVLGLGTGYLANMVSSGSAGMAKTDNESGTDASGDKTSAGVLDKKTFTDQAEGTLKEGGFEGEGSFHLERPGGKSQYVYLTSTAVDLSEFVGKKVKVWGQTFEAEKAGWLMDVGYVELSK